MKKPASSRRNQTYFKHPDGSKNGDLEDGRGKKGRARGCTVRSTTEIFFVPGFPLEQVFDPTGAGDAFAGGLLGYISKKNSTSVADLRRAVVYGSVLGSFAVQKFSIDGLRDLTESDIFRRVKQLNAMTTFEIDEGVEDFA